MKQILLPVLLCFSVTIAAQSPWTQKKGKAYSQLSFSTISSYDELYGDPNYNTERKITDNTLRIYGEYGISDQTTVFAAIPFKTVKAEGLTRSNITPVTSVGSTSSAGNILFGVKHNFYKKKWLITGQLGIEANTSKYNADAGLRTGYDAWTVTPLISAGRSFSKMYIQGYTGLDYRTNDYSSAFKVGGEIGYEIVKTLWFAGFADGVANFGNGSVITPAANRLTGLYVDGQSYAAFGLKILYEANEEFGVNLGAGLALGGRRVPRQPAISAGIYYKFL